MHKNEMSYAEYRDILSAVKQSGKYCDYLDVKPGAPFLVLRHDVEFSVERAFGLHLLELEAGIVSSFFFQLTNNTYNILSHENIRLIREMHEGGHHIGLHYHLPARYRLADLPADIRLQADVMEKMLGFKIDRFSLHRPQKDILQNHFTVEGLLNTYDPMFFTYSEVFDDAHPLEVKYIADSMHRWKYGYPDLATLNRYDKVQLLIHPYSWTEAGHDNLDNFRSLIAEKRAELIETLDDECMHFNEVRDAI